ncbi:hypothetical protein B0T22DRAFT_168824 [Podospora appendiculata]|uniref:Transmembrane protein n=1 Tax=Podospora appendiculata TaxID=314037 RepID=A0AAE0XAV7_9PEZI|nr:hypothetical protein B0T22DRAFT_168824 [Podospora appendiculata]
MGACPQTERLIVRGCAVSSEASFGGRANHRPGGRVRSPTSAGRGVLRFLRIRDPRRDWEQSRAERCHFSFLPFLPIVRPLCLCLLSFFSLIAFHIFSSCPSFWEFDHCWAIGCLLFGSLRFFFVAGRRIHSVLSSVRLCDPPDLFDSPASVDLIA